MSFTVKLFRALALVLFASTMIGAQDCVFDQIGKPVPPPPTKPYCMTDPPYFCVGICNAPMVGATWVFSDPCTQISSDAAAKTSAFKAAVLATPCDPDAGLLVLTPRLVGIVPVEIESSGACMHAPPW